jgi:hypothetical protein
VADEIDADTAPDPAVAVADAPPAEAPAAETPAPPVDEVARLREELARRDGELAALREAAARTPAAAAPPPPADEITLENIQAALQAGRITEARAESLRGVLLAEERQRQRAAQAEAAEAQHKALATLERHVAERPALRQPGSPEHTAVMQWIREHGGAVTDLAWQAAACTAVYGGPRGGGVVDRRGLTPSGGTGGRPASVPASAATKPGVPAALAGIPAEYVAYWKRGANLDDPAVAKRYAERYWASRPGRMQRAG